MKFKHFSPHHSPSLSTQIISLIFPPPPSFDPSTSASEFSASDNWQLLDWQPERMTSCLSRKEAEAAIALTTMLILPCSWTAFSSVNLKALKEVSIFTPFASENDRLGEIRSDLSKVNQEKSSKAVYVTHLHQGQTAVQLIHSPP